MESTIDNPIIVEITEQEAKRKGNVGKYLNKLVVPGCLYIVEQVPDFMASCLYNITKPMLVFSSMACGGQLLMEAAESEISINLSKLKDNETYTSARDMIICKKLSKLEKKPIWIDESEKLMAINLYHRCQKLKKEHDIQVVLMDDYRLLVDDYFQEIPDGMRLQMLQTLAEKFGISIIAQDCPPKEANEGMCDGKNHEQVFHVNWWDDTPKTGTNSIFDYWEIDDE